MVMDNPLILAHAAEILAASPMGIKIIELLGKGIGSLSEPWLILRKSEAEAMAHAHKVYSEELARHLARQRIRSNTQSQESKESDLQNISAELSSISRLIAGDLKHQNNISSIFIEAVNQGSENLSNSADVSEDWFQKFLSEAKNISDTDVQNMWGRILAGEIEKPGSFSIRSLSILRNISSAEAQLFHILASQSVRVHHPDWTGDELFPFVMLLNNNYLLPRGMSYGVLESLQDAGLIHMWPTQRTYNLSALGEYVSFKSTHGSKEITFRRGSNLSAADNGNLHVGHVSFSRAGAELAKLATKDDDFTWWSVNSSHSWFNHGGWTGVPEVKSV